MKVKHTNFFQRHVEKIVLATAALIGVIIILIYVVGTPYTASIANEDLGPNGIEKRLEQASTQLKTRLEDPQSPIKPRIIPSYTKDFLARVNRPVLPAQRYRVTLAPSGLGNSDVGPQAPKQAYNLPHPPATQNVVAIAGLGVLGQAQNQTEQQQLIRLVGDQQPRDFRYASVSADFDLGEWIKRLEQASDLPHTFWRSMIGLSAVYLERQELDPETGQWGHDTIVKPLPGQVAVLPTHTQDYTTQQADQVVRFIEAHQEQVARPQFPPMTQNMVWLPPTEKNRQLNPKQQRELKNLREDITRLETQIKLFQQNLERQAQAKQRAGQNRRQAPQRQAPRRRPNAAQAPGMGMGGPGGLGGPDEFGEPGMGMTQRRVVPQPGQGDQSSDQLNQLLQRLQEKKAQRDKLLGIEPDAASQANAYGMNPYGEPGMMPPGEVGSPEMGLYGPGVYGGRLTRQQLRNMPPNARRQYLLQRRMGEANQNPNGQQAQQVSNKIHVWAHDLTVEPGKTYRYRVIVAVLNPLFHQSRVSADQREQNFGKLSLGPDKQELAQSPWSDPVKIDPKYYFFFLSGSAQSDTATVEVWRVYDGQWRSTQFQVRPGDPIGGLAKIQDQGQQLTIPMRVGAVVVDLVSAANAGPLSSGTRLLYTEPGSQAIALRNPKQDRDSSVRVRLQNEAALQKLRAQAVASIAP